MKYFPRENFMVVTQEGLSHFNSSHLSLPSCKLIAHVSNPRTEMSRDSVGALNKMAEWLDLEMPSGWPHIRPVNVGATDRKPMTEAARKLIYDFYHPYNVQLEELLRTKFSWT